MLIYVCVSVCVKEVVQGLVDSGLAFVTYTHMYKQMHTYILLHRFGGLWTYGWLWAVKICMHVFMYVCM